MGKLDGKVCVITGASRGIGAEIAVEFAKEGGKIVAAARTLHEGDHILEGSLDYTVAQIKEAGGEATASAVNISEHDDCERLIAEAHAAYGQIDVLVN
ncbi:MAG: SDR family NAD(P)-dependent oxidoreductase, partial [SAR202 cluster bacterium]|nr:SDR family NAD(P)-dependent oxidoreductase [SAR202 cluster bacterium]